MATPTTPDFSAELREKYPRKALEADHGSSRASAIHLNCRECIQAVSAADCPTTTCFLFPFRPGADSEGSRQRKPGDVPSREQYEEILRLRDPDGAKAAEARKRFGHDDRQVDDDGIGIGSINPSPGVYTVALDIIK